MYFDPKSQMYIIFKGLISRCGHTSVFWIVCMHACCILSSCSNPAEKGLQVVQSAINDVVRESRNVIIYWQDIGVMSVKHWKITKHCLNDCTRKNKPSSCHARGYH